MFSLLMVQLCIAQSGSAAKPKKDNEVQFTPPVIKKDADSIQAVKFTPPVIKKNKATKKKPEVQFTPPTIAKDNE